jgi:hypothetical protein
MDHPETFATLNTQDTRQGQTNKNTTQNTKTMNNTNPTKSPGVLAKGKQFLPLIRHP